MARLIIYEEIDDENTIYETYDLSASRILVGSDRDNQLILDAPEIDPAHASLELRDNHWFLQDLGGPGGTAVNGQLIQGPCRLRHNDVIELGFIKMRFHHQEPGLTEEYPVAQANAKGEHSAPRPEVQLSGRVWFAGLFGGTLFVIVGILLLLALGHVAGVINLFDLMPGLFGQ